MVKAIVDISENANRILNIIKAKKDLKSKNDALNLVVTLYGQEMLEPELRPEFIKEMMKAQKEKTTKVGDWNSHFGVD